MKRYRDVRGLGYEDSNLYNIYFSNTDTKLSALYARAPKPDIKRCFADSQDDAARVAALLLQRNLIHEMDCSNFDSTFKHLFDHVVSGMGVSWVRLEQDEMPQPPLLHPETGEQFAQPSVITRQEACTDYVAWDDFFWSPCKVWTMCSWVARRIPMTRDAIKARFGDKVPAELIKDIAYSTKPEAQDRSARW